MNLHSLCPIFAAPARPEWSDLSRGPTRASEHPMTRVIVGCAVAVVGFVGAAILAFPAASGALWGLAAGTSVALIGYGVRRHQPARRAPWLLLAGALATLGLGDIAHAFGDAVTSGGWLLIAELCYLAMFPLLASALLHMTRSSAVLRHRSA